MILLYHNTKYVTEVYNDVFDEHLDFQAKSSIVQVVLQISKKYPNTLLIWCNEKYKSWLNKEAICSVFHHQLILSSYSITGNYCISNRIGYIEQTPFTNISRTVTYPTWLMSSDVGGCNSSILNKCNTILKPTTNFDYFLCSFAKLAMPRGVFCYSEPNFIKDLAVKEKVPENNSKTSITTLFKFIKQHYKSIWIVNLFVCLICFEKYAPFLPFVKSIFCKRLKNNFDFQDVSVQSKREVVKSEKYDVIIPTIGRKNYLYDVLKDLSNQTILPEQVIIVEQNPDTNSTSELEYINSEAWPFKINHKLIHQTGACNARNLAISQIENEWVFLGDDDIRFDNGLIRGFFKEFKSLGNEVLMASCLKLNQKQNYVYPHQTPIFGSGCSMLKTKLLKQISFDVSFEFGFGEDADYGMQIRKIGQDIIYTPDIRITHLKAPMGGFRTKHSFLWDKDDVKPRPSPTVMLYYKKNFSKYQILGAKYIYSIKFYKKQSIKNPVKYIKTMNKKWKRSEYWSAILNNKVENA